MAPLHLYYHHSENSIQPTHSREEPNRQAQASAPVAPQQSKKPSKQTTPTAPQPAKKPTTPAKPAPKPQPAKKPAAPAPKKSPPADKPAASCDIKGNISSKKEKIYHVPGGAFYTKTVIDTNKGERWSCSEAEAVSAGWRASKR